VTLMAARANARPAAGQMSVVLDLPTVTAGHASVDQQRRGREPCPLDPRRILTETDLEAALARLLDLSSDATWAAYRKLYRRSPPAPFSRDLLIRALAYRLQEQVRGGLSPETKLLLDRLARGKAQSARWIKPGSTIVRSWGGQTHQVVVTAEGFLWNGSAHASLSEIARLITGTRWNGPRFFGLRPSPARKSKAVGSGQEVSDTAVDPTPSPRRRGRPRKAPASSVRPERAEAHHGL
jgi:DUF2924 family protein